MSDKHIKEITQNIPNDELSAAYDALMNSSLNGSSSFDEISAEELNEYIEGLECQADDLRTKLAKANERVRELESYNLSLANESHNKSVEIDFLNARAKELKEKNSQLRSKVGVSSANIELEMNNKSHRNKILTQAKIEALESCIDNNVMDNNEIDALIIYVDDVRADIEQLRKEQASE